MIYDNPTLVTNSMNLNVKIPLETMISNNNNDITNNSNNHFNDTIVPSFDESESASQLPIKHRLSQCNVITIPFNQMLFDLN